MVSHIAARGRTHGVRVINISELGLMCRTDAEVSIGERVSVWLPVVKDVQAEVRWAEEGRVGMEFRDPIEPRAYEAMLNIIPNVRLILFGALIIVFLVVEPEGLNRLWRNIRSYFRVWPFAY